MTDEERSERRFKRQMTRLVDAIFDSPIYAAELEAKGGIVSDFRPSRYDLGPMLKIRQPDTYRRTDVCTQQQLRDAEAIAFQDHASWRAGLIAFYRHAQFGADHPDGYLGELFGHLLTKESQP